MFSWLHLRDLINQQLLVAPVILRRPDPGLDRNHLAAQSSGS
ncbi:MAG: hypothetical protein R2873_28070 [Caldilineaceae bacterium]